MTMFEIQTLSGETRNLMDVAEAIELEGKLDTGRFISRIGERCSLGVAYDYLPSDIDTPRHTDECNGWILNDKLIDIIMKLFGHSIYYLNDVFEKGIDQHSLKTQQTRAKFMASVYRQLAWLDEKGEFPRTQHN